MSNQQTKQAVPRLRFPEFLESGAWEEKSLEMICDMQAGQFVQASKIHPNKKSDMFPCYGGNGLRGYTYSFTHSGQYSLIGRQGALCGNITYAIGDFHATEHAVVVTTKKNVITKWLYYLLSLLDLNRYATGQAQPGLSVQVIGKVETYTPNSAEEQQKIADCLSSLDDLITAHARKLDALKLHKKGLMQKLFPAEGETIPEWRFPDFAESGAWEEKKLGEVCEYKASSLTVANATLDGEYDFYDANQVIGKVDVSCADHPYITVIKDGAGVGRLRVLDGGTNFVGTMGMLSNNRLSVFQYLYYLLSSIDFNIYVIGSTIPHIYFKDYSKHIIQLPSIPEQQKIAECLSSLDDLITAQTNKLEALKLHKKGLLQGLFPSMEEVPHE